MAPSTDPMREMRAVLNKQRGLPGVLPNERAIDAMRVLRPLERQRSHDEMVGEVQRLLIEFIQNAADFVQDAFAAAILPANGGDGQLPELRATKTGVAWLLRGRVFLAVDMLPNAWVLWQTGGPLCSDDISTGTQSGTAQASDNGGFGDGWKSAMHGHTCIPRGSAFAGFSRILHRGPSLSPTVHRPALRGASRWFLPRSACPNNSAWVRMVTGPTSSASADVHWG